MPELHVNIDHVATLRQARRIDQPDPVHAALAAEAAGAAGITVHLREDRRHIQDRDVRLLRQLVKTRLNLEIAATAEMVDIAREVRPDLVMLVPENRLEVTTEGGLDVAGANAETLRHIRALLDSGLRVSLFIDPDERQVRASREAGAGVVELHTGTYVNAAPGAGRNRELDRLMAAAAAADGLGLLLNAGHGLNYHNVQPVCRIPRLRELHIGHGIVSRAVMCGMDLAVRDMVSLIRTA